MVRRCSNLAKPYRQYRWGSATNSAAKGSTDNSDSAGSTDGNAASIQAVPGVQMWGSTISRLAHRSECLLLLFVIISAILYLARASRAKLVGIGSRRPLCERWRRSSSGLLMALGKILLGAGLRTYTWRTA